MAAGTKVSAYILSENNADTIERAVESVRNQTIPVDEIFVIDNASNDNSLEVLKKMGIRTIAHDVGLGRGELRDKAMKIAKNELVLCVNGNMVIGPTFLQQALESLEKGKVGGVFGRVTLNERRSTAEKWIARQVYGQDDKAAYNRRALLLCAGALLRKSAVEQVSGFDRSCLYGEDRDLGRRLLKTNYAVVCDPALIVVDIEPKTKTNALETYWRWNAEPTDRFNTFRYLQLVGNSICIMMMKDILSGDFSGAGISLSAPHYRLWRSKQLQESK